MPHIAYAKIGILLELGAEVEEIAELTSLTPETVHAVIDFDQKRMKRARTVAKLYLHGITRNKIVEMTDLSHAGVYAHAAKVREYKRDLDALRAPKEGTIIDDSYLYSMPTCRIDAAAELLGVTVDQVKEAITRVGSRLLVPDKITERQLLLVDEYFERLIDKQRKAVAK